MILHSRNYILLFMMMTAMSKYIVKKKIKIVLVAPYKIVFLLFFTLSYGIIFSTVGGFPSVYAWIILIIICMRTQILRYFVCTYISYILATQFQEYKHFLREL